MAFNRLFTSSLLLSKDYPMPVFILYLLRVMLYCCASVKTVKLFLHSGVDNVT